MSACECALIVRCVCVHTEKRVGKTAIWLNMKISGIRRKAGKINFPFLNQAVAAANATDAAAAKAATSKNSSDSGELTMESWAASAAAAPQFGLHCMQRP